MKRLSRFLIMPLGALLAGTAPAAAQLIPNLPEIPRTTVTDQVATEEGLQTNTQIFTNAISARVADALRPFGLHAPASRQQTAMGIAMGGVELTAGELTTAPISATWGAWGRAATSWLDDDYTDTAMNGRIHAPVLGVDKVQNGTVLGFSLGYERVDLSTKFNDGRLTADGVSFLPYIGTLLTDDLVLDAGLAYTRLRYHRQDNRHTSRASRREFDADRLLLFSNLTAHAPVEWTGDGLGVAAITGLSWALESQEGSQDSSGRDVDGGLNRLGRWTVGLRADSTPRASADGTPGFAPMASLTYQLDFVQSNDTELNETQRPKDRSTLLGALGFSVGLAPGAQLTVEYNRLFARRKMDSQTLLAGARISL
jgi:hypothetical protein